MKVELSNLVNNVGVIKNIQILYKTLCDVLSFTKDIRDQIEKQQLDLTSIGHSLNMDTSSSLIHYNIMIFAQVKLAELQAIDGRMRAKLIFI